MAAPWWCAAASGGEAACRGAKAAGGTTVGLLPARPRGRQRLRRHRDSHWLGEARNALVVLAADLLIAVGGAHGTLSEIALALKSGKRVIGLGSWDIEGVEPADDPEAAVASALS